MQIAHNRLSLFVLGFISDSRIFHRFYFECSIQLSHMYKNVYLTVKKGHFEIILVKNVFDTS